MRHGVLPRVALACVLVAACSPPPPLPEDIDGGPVDASTRDTPAIDARRDGVTPGRGAAGDPCASDGDCNSGMRCLDSLSAEGVKYCAPPCSARSECESFGQTSYYLPVPYANDYNVDHFTRGFGCVEAPGSSTGSQKYCQFACGNNQFVNFDEGGNAVCNCLPDFERRRDTGRAYCTYNPVDECSFFRDCVGTPQCGVLTCAITRGLRGACFNTTGGDPRSYVDCFLGSTDCDSSCIENCLSSGAGASCSDACCTTRPPETPVDAGVRDTGPRDTGTPDTGTPDTGPAGLPDLQIQRASWYFYRPTIEDPRYSACINANRDGTAAPQGGSVVIVNRGTARSGEAEVGLGFANAAGESLSVPGGPRVPPLEPGESHSITGPLCVHGSFRMVAAGTYRSATFVDREATVRESDETNNLSIGTYTFTWDPTVPADCRACTTSAQCASGESCGLRRCDGRGVCNRPGSGMSCPTVAGVACTSSSLWGACARADDPACPSTSRCASFEGGTGSHCAFRCSTSADCRASPDAAFDARQQYCTAGGLCLMRCAGLGDTCPGVTRCSATTEAGVFICI